MKVDLLILQLAIIFLPGLIWASLDSAYAARVKPSETQFFLRAFMFGIVVYAVEFLIFAAFGRPFQMADIADASSHTIVSKGVFAEILFALLIGALLSIGWLYVARFKFLSKFLQKIGATKKYGDEDIWDFVFNSRDKATEYVHFRDFDHELVYCGWVNAFSETDRVRELVLLNVVVYNFSGEEVYQTPRLYLARGADAIHMEFPYQPPDNLVEDTPE